MKDFRNFLRVIHKWHWLKTLKVSRKCVDWKLVKFRVIYILVECPVYVREQKDKTESILLRSDYDTPSQGTECITHIMAKKTTTQNR